MPSPPRACFWLALLLAAAQSGPAPAQPRPGPVEEEANCVRVAAMVEANAAPVLRELERLARQRHGRGFAALDPEQVLELTRLVGVTGRQATAEQERLSRRCDTWR
jgi:hypothetical protein